MVEQLAGVVKKNVYNAALACKKISLPRGMNMGEGIFLQAMWNLEMFFLETFSF